jgi:predicted nuclease of predicted toxin-antitoxin system
VKLLFDQNLSFKLCERLRDLYPGSTQVRLVSLDQAQDETVWEYARQNNFVMVTKDSDFANMSMVRGWPPKVIRLGCGNQPASTIEQLLRTHAAEILRFGNDRAFGVLEIP